MSFEFMADSIVKQTSHAFALEVIRLCTRLKQQKQFELAGQLLRCGTGIGANVEEALAGYSRREFAAKRSIASKEPREANDWLRLLIDAGILAGDDVDELLAHSEELIRMLTSIVKTTRSARDTTVTKLKTQN